eukprot:647998-Prorocentrum_minimum.AAC.1
MASARFVARPSGVGACLCTPPVSDPIVLVAVTVFYHWSLAGRVPEPTAEGAGNPADSPGRDNLQPGNLRLPDRNSGDGDRFGTKSRRGSIRDAFNRMKAAASAKNLYSPRMQARAQAVKEFDVECEPEEKRKGKATEYEPEEKRKGKATEYEPEEERKGKATEYEPEEKSPPPTLKSALKGKGNSPPPHETPRGVARRKVRSAPGRAGRRPPPRSSHPASFGCLHII